MIAMKVTVIGNGRWGSFIAWYLDQIGLSVALYGRSNSAKMEEIIKTRANQYLHFRESILLTTDLEVINDCEIIVIAINAQGLAKLAQELTAHGCKNKVIVLCMKGIEIGTGKRLSQVMHDHIDLSNKIAVWLGPGHVQAFTQGVPNCMVIDSNDEHVKHQLVDTFSSPLIRFYYGNDMIGNEIGAATKNVIGIAAGMLDGLELGTLKGALMSRGTKEISRLIVAMGGSEMSAYGLCHLGDYEATVFSPFSHNRKFGECFVRHQTYGELAEGYYTVKALMDLEKKYKVELPICHAIYNVLYNEKDAKDELQTLFLRSLKQEF